MQGMDQALGPEPVPTPPVTASVCKKQDFSLLSGGSPGQAAPTRHAESTCSHPTAQAVENVNLQLHSVLEGAERQN